MKKLFNVKTFIVFFVLFIGLMVFGTFFDLQVSNVLYTGGNLFTKICAVAGAGFPCGVAVCAAAVMMIASDNKKYKSVTIVKWLIAMCGDAYALYTMIGDVLKEGGSKIVVIIELLLLAIFSITFYLKIRNYKNKRKLVLFSLAIFSIIAGGSIVIIALKKISARPRMRLIVKYPLIKFCDWYNFDQTQKIKYIAQGISEGEFNSFPSAHAFFSTSTCCLWMIASFNEKLKGKELLLFIVGVLYSITICVTRIICGAHFVTDASVGFMVGIVSQFVCYMVYLRKLN